MVAVGAGRRHCWSPVFMLALSHLTEALVPPRTVPPVSSFLFSLFPVLGPWHFI